MRADYQVHVYDSQRQPLKSPLDNYTRLEYVKRLNGSGLLNLSFKLEELPRGTDLERLACDGRVVVWRQPEELENKIDMAGLMRYARPAWYGQDLHLGLKGYGYNSLLGYRRVPFDAGSAEADKSGAADTVIWEIWDENLGASAAADRQMTGEGFSLGTVAGTGTSVGLAFSRALVSDAVQKAAIQSRDAMATAVYYGFVPIGDGTEARFDIRTGFWGKDRRTDGKLLFGLEQGNMLNPDYVIDRRDELTVVYPAGSGRKENRIEGTPQTSARLTDSPLNRREGLFDGRNMDVVATLEDAAREKVEAAGVIRRMEFDVQETDTCRYGVHWDLGDIVPGEFLDLAKHDFIIAGVRVVVAAGDEWIHAILEEYVE